MVRRHKHSPYSFDGYYEHCKCGACAGDRRDPETGLRYTSFEEWEEA